MQIKKRHWFAGGLTLALVIVAIYIGPTLWTLAQDRDAVQALVVQLGWMGPIVLVVANAAQIVIAPVPGYVFQLAAGYLYGPIWGGIWGSIGLMTGAALAMWLARVYGRPLVQRLIGADRLAKWENVTHSTNIAVWFMLLLGPTGDIPYFLAGLSRVSFLKVIALTAVLRIPSIFVMAGAGAGVMYLTWWQLAVVVGILTALVVVFMRYQDEILARMDRFTYTRMMTWLGINRSKLRSKLQPSVSPKPLSTNSISANCVDAKLSRDEIT